MREMVDFDEVVAWDGKRDLNSAHHNELITSVRQIPYQHEHTMSSVADGNIKERSEKGKTQVRSHTHSCSFSSPHVRCQLSESASPGQPRCGQMMRLLTTCRDGTFAIWHSKTLKLERIVTNSQFWVTDSCYLKEAHKIAISSMDRSISFYGERSPGADVLGASPVSVPMLQWRCKRA
jgi:WD40 repeat protein